MTTQLKRAVTYLLSFTLAGFLFYLALRGVDFEELKSAAQKASYGWVIPLIGVILFSHGLRAWRWQILLDALPDRQRTGELRSVSFKNAFLSVMIGYFVNLLVPRFGEIVRTGNLARQEGLRFSGVFGTVIVERIIDLIVLLMGVASLSFFFYEDFLFLNESILSQVISKDASIPLLWPLIGLMGVGMVTYFAYRTFTTSQSARLLHFRRRVISIFKSFREGILTALKAPRRIELILITVVMWFCYTLLAYIPLLMLNMPDRFDIGLTDSWSLMILGSIGIALPSPGGTGTYHYITKLALVSLYAVDEATAVIYAILAHGIHVIVYILAGGIALFIQGTTLKSLRSTTVDTD